MSRTVELRNLARLVVVIACLLPVVACRPDLVLRMTTVVFHDGSLERRLEVHGKPDDPDEKIDADWLAETVGVRLAAPQAWERVSRGADRLEAGGFFSTVEALPSTLAFDTSAGERADRVQASLAVEERGILRRFSWRESFGDPFAAQEVDAAIGALIELTLDALRHELRLHFGDGLDVGPAERLARGEWRALLTAIVYADRRAAVPGTSGGATLVEVLRQFGVSVPTTEETENDAVAELLSRWMRERLAAALSGPERSLAPDAFSFWPLGDDFSEDLDAIIARTWGDEERFQELAEPHLEALSGYYGSGSSPRFRFESRLRLPGRLLRTNGTPEGRDIVWFFRSEDLTLGDRVLEAVAVEPIAETLTRLGARRDWETAGLLQLEDLLFARDADGALLALLDDAIRAGRLTPLRDLEGIEDDRLRQLGRELTDLLDPDVPPPDPL